MSSEGETSFVRQPAPAGHLDHRHVGDEVRWIDPDLPIGQVRLARALRERARDPAGMETYLEALPTWQRVTALFTLRPIMGAERASQICRSAFGRDVLE